MDKDLARAVLNPNWSPIEDCLRKSRDRAITALINAKDADESNRLRGEIRGLDNLLRLPEQARRFKDGVL